jgi:hypothetical protein
MTKREKFYRGAGVFLGLLAAGIAAFVITAYSIPAQNKIVSNISSVPAKLQPTASGTIVIPVAIEQPAAANRSALAASLITSSFSDLFSGAGWLNTAETTMYQDRFETALTFPPKFEWKKESSDVSATPAVFGISGKVSKSGGIYKGLIYGADGVPIFNEVNTPIVSNYEGVLGVGGDPDDFLAVYGAYQAQAFRIFRTASGWAYENVSRFFGNRVMNGGFEPAIIKSGGNFYVWSKTPEKPKLIKLFMNGGADISGAVDLSQSIFSGSEKAAVFSPAKVGSGATLTARVTDASGAVLFYSFSDRGFDKSKTLQVVSSNISDYPADTYTAVISELDFSGSGSKAAFSLSNDGENWRPAELGRLVNFPAGSRSLFWKAEFTPDGDPLTSPFLDRIRVDYQVKPF